MINEFQLYRAEVYTASSSLYTSQSFSMGVFKPVVGCGLWVVGCG